VDGIDQRLVPFTINLECQSDVSLQMTISNEFSQGGLINPRRLAANGSASHL